MKTICLTAFLAAVIACHASQPWQWMNSNAAPPSSGPAFAGQEQLIPSTAASGTTGTITVSNAIASGTTVVALVAVNAASSTMSSPTDSRGNTWTIDASKVNPQGDSVSLYNLHSKLATGLQANDTITFTLSTSGSTFYGSICTVTGSAGLDVTATNAQTATSITCAAATGHAPDVVVGQIWVNSISGVTYTGGNWATYSSQNYFPYQFFYLNYAVSATGSQNPQGTLSTSQDCCTLWCAFY